MHTRRNISLFKLGRRATPDNASLTTSHRRPYGRRCAELNLSPAGSIRPGLDLTAADAATIGPLERDLELIGVLGGKPCQFDSPLELGLQNKRVSRPQELASYGRYISQLAAHYRGDIHTWQSWHVPNRSSGWGDVPDPELYAGLLEIQYEAIKQVDPNARLALGPIAGCDLPFLARTLQALGGRTAFDTLAVLPYRWHGPETENLADITCEDGVTKAQMDWKQELVALNLLTTRLGYSPNILIAELDWPSTEAVELKPTAMLRRGGESHHEEIERQARHIEASCELLRDDPELDFVESALAFDLEAAKPEPLPQENIALTREFEEGIEAEAITTDGTQVSG